MPRMREAASRDRADIAAYYDDYSSWYEGERRDGYYGVINDLEFDRIEPSVTGRRALEIGCGTGLILTRVDGVAERAIGIDLSPGMAGVSRRKGLCAANAAVDALPFADDSFDVVYSCKVLAHVPDLLGALREIRRVLRTGGRAFLEFYNPWSFKRLTYRLVSLWRRSEPVFIRFDRRVDVERILPPGLEVRSARGIRVLAATGHFYTLPVLGPIVRRLDRRLCDTWFGQRFGGYLLLELAAPGTS